ncbi:hypothetical protein MNEG_5686 [Monoraphidium neglectum]|uniref:Uncharacterized protein n=1 Tax=Monoraphidium neglectum TaxID=145388 RepID=A0A0D2MP32_9CHLO|nr:hypothetical protein MNEG_5686 [Monoraphidium neglectum]KIZ02272.1 hypothetical protein MNEG_5686 [Monoraphidium neglectum]|eukprot:XP_013901291.1 hypothetical protein MNEG_5686 [Monoraphidium neglectum]
MYSRPTPGDTRADAGVATHRGWRQLRAAPLATRPAARIDRAPRAPRHIATTATGDAEAAFAHDRNFLGGVCTLLAAVVLLKGAAGAVAPDQLLGRSLGVSSVGTLNAALTSMATSVCWIYAAWLVVLKEALDHNRLGSDTYRRLALGLAVLSAALLAMVVRYRDILSTGLLSEPALLGVSSASLALIFWVSNRLYQIGSGGRGVLADAGRAAQQFVSDVASCIRVPPNFYSEGPLPLALFIGLFAARRVPLLPGGLDYVGRYLMQASAAGTWLIGITAFTLKDAADRGRLGASTFRLLNLALAATLAQRMWCIYSLGASGVELAQPLAKFALAQGLFGAGVCGVAYLTAKK